MLKAKIEAVLFLTDKPMKAQAIARTLNEDAQVVRQAILELIHDYEERAGGLELADDNGYIIQVKDAYSTLINEFAPLEMPVGLLRTLSAIAIKQPVQQSEIIKIRGAGAYDHIKELMVRELVIKKEADEGRSPLLSTTKQFQEYFRLSGDGKSLRTELRKTPKPAEADKPADIAAVQLQLGESGQAVQEPATPSIDGTPDYSHELAPAANVDETTANVATLDVPGDEPRHFQHGSVPELNNEEPSPEHNAVPELNGEEPSAEHGSVPKMNGEEPSAEQRATSKIEGTRRGDATREGAVQLPAASEQDEMDDEVAPTAVDEISSVSTVGVEQLEEIFDSSPDNAFVFRIDKNKLLTEDSKEKLATTDELDAAAEQDSVAAPSKTVE